MTSVSLFANAIFFFAFITAIVGLIPIIPTIAVTTTSTSSNVEISISPSIPETTLTLRSDIIVLSSFALTSSYTQTILGINSLICSSNKTTLLFADKEITFKSLFFLTISRVCVPIEPVEPNIAIFFIF